MGPLDVTAYRRVTQKASYLMIEFHRVNLLNLIVRKNLNAIGALSEALYMYSLALYLR